MNVARNQHVKDMCITSRVSCLDDFASIWTNKFTCPGCLFVPRKPHSKGNEYHNICCGESRIIYR